MIWIVWFFQQSWLHLYFPDIGKTGSIFPRRVQKQFYVWANRDQPVENWYSYTAAATCEQLSHMCTICQSTQLSSIQTKNKTYSANAGLWCIIQICCFAWGSFRFSRCWALVGNSWLCAWVCAYEIIYVFMCFLPPYMQKYPTHICLLPEVLLFS